MSVFIIEAVTSSDVVHVLGLDQAILLLHAVFGVLFSQFFHFLARIPILKLFWTAFGYCFDLFFLRREYDIALHQRERGIAERGWLAGEADKRLPWSHYLRAVADVTIRYPSAVI